MKNTISTFKDLKEKGEKLALLTAYDYSMAKLIDSTGVNGILVGDSLGMVCLGYENTLSVTMEDMLHHTKAVARGTKNALLIGDMPFMSYHTSTYDSVKNAGRFIQEANAQAVKLEGGAHVLEQIKAIVKAQIPVMGHLGLTPQSVNVFGGFKVQGRDLETARELIEDAKRLEDAGVFSIVLECIPSEIAKLITEAVKVPTIGIGAGNACDGQILVYQDMLNLFDDIKPKFVKIFSDAGATMRTGIKEYIKEVKAGSFPTDKHSFLVSDEVLNKLY
ncbi:MAG TPA: 3-methyl-2-oxobutanoate hydroxymethyltransferase [Clostridiaceae bacterium]